MARDLSSILVIDIEATCYEKGQEPPGFEPEIIEVGWAFVDFKDGDPYQTRAGTQLICPQAMELSPFCESLTGLTRSKLERAGVHLYDLTKALNSHRHYPWASWGDYDRRQLERECSRKAIPYPLGPTHLNLKTLASLTFGWPEELGMAEALSRLGLPLEGTHHRGGDDAWNIAAILVEMLKQWRGLRIAGRT